MILKRPPVVIDRDPKSETFVSIATFIPIARWSNVFSSFKLSNQVEGQLKKTRGIVVYSLAVNLPRRHFWTYSIWSDRTLVPAFTRAEPHAIAIEQFKDWAGEGAAFVEWESAEAKLDWNEAFARLKQPTFTYKKPG